jgi:hypothetical protein
MRKLAALLVVVSLGGCATHRQTPVRRVIVTKAETGRSLSARESRIVRVPDKLHVYKIGRLPTQNGDGMTEAANYYHIDQSAYWNRFVPGSRVTSTGPAGVLGSQTYRIGGNDQEVRELRNEAQADKAKVVAELRELQLANEKVNAAISGIEQTNKIVVQAQNEINQLRTENLNLKRQQAEVAVAKKSVDTDFSQFEKVTQGTQGNPAQPANDLPTGSQQ